MSFVLIKGHFHPKAGVPDGDSVRFLADDLSLWSRLEGKPVKPSTSPGPLLNTVQLRLEGIDSIEKGATVPLSTDSRDNLFRLIGFDATHLEPKGYILSRMTDDQSKRPICFAFSGHTTRSDGSDQFLDETMLRDSVNYMQMLEGYAYPLYYNTLFADLRNAFYEALDEARSNGLGYWPKDKTRKGVTVSSSADLKTIAPIWPKLWRRLQTFLGTGKPMSKFIEFLTVENERIDILSIMEERGLQDVVKVTGNKVKLTEAPENLRIRGDAGLRG